MIIDKIDITKSNHIKSNQAMRTKNFRKRTLEQDPRVDDPDDDEEERR